MKISIVFLSFLSFFEKTPCIIFFLCLDSKHRTNATEKNKTPYTPLPAFLCDGLRQRLADRLKELNPSKEYVANLFGVFEVEKKEG